MTCNKRNASIWKADFSNGGNWRLNIVAISPWNSRKTLPVIIKRNLTGWKGTLTFIKIFPVESRVWKKFHRWMITEEARLSPSCIKFPSLIYVASLKRLHASRLSRLNTITNRKIDHQSHSVVLITRYVPHFNAH